MSKDIIIEILSCPLIEAKEILEFNNYQCINNCALVGATTPTDVLTYEQKPSEQTDVQIRLEVRVFDLTVVRAQMFRNGNLFNDFSWGDT